MRPYPSIAGAPAGRPGPADDPRANAPIWPPVVLAGVVMASALGFWTLRGEGDPPSDPAPVRHVQVTAGGQVVDAALSPDGRALASAVRAAGPEVRVRVRQLDDGETFDVWRGRGLSTLRWTPDGDRLLVAGPGGSAAPDCAPPVEMVLVPRLGGVPRPVPGFEPSRLFPDGRCEADGPIGAPVVALSSDGTRLAGAYGQSRGVVVAPVEGGAGRRLDLPRVGSIVEIAWKPHSDQLAVLGVDREGVDGVWLLYADGGPLDHVPMPDGTVTSACWAPETSVLYVQLARGDTTTLLRVARNLRGTPVAQVVATGLPPTRGSCQVSPDGRDLLHIRTATVANLWRLELVAPGAKPAAVTSGASTYTRPRLSPDGRWVAATRDAGAGPRIVRIPVAGGPPRPMVAGVTGTWSPDGRRFAFVSDRDGEPRIRVGDADGHDAAALADSRVGADPFVTWLPDGRLAWATPDGRHYRIRDIVTGQEDWLMRPFRPERALGPPRFALVPRWRPDGEALAAVRDRSTGRRRGWTWTVLPPAPAAHLTAARLWPAGRSLDGDLLYALRPPGGGSAAECSQTADFRVAVCSVPEPRADVWRMQDFDRHAHPAAAAASPS